MQSNNRKRSPLKDGLPTLEEHRNKEVREAANHLFALGNTSVFIGDSLPSMDELKDLSTLKPNVIELNIHVNTKDEVTLRLLNQVYSARTDEARDAIRASESRLILNGDIIEPFNTVDKKYGDITIDNKDYQRTNVVGFVLQKDLFLLKYIIGSKQFQFNINK